MGQVFREDFLIAVAVEVFEPDEMRAGVAEGVEQGFEQIAPLPAFEKSEGVVVVDRAIETHVFGLRKKLGAFADFVETIRGVGYRVAEL